MLDSERIGVDFTKFAKKNALSDLENKMLFRTQLLEEQIDQLIEFQEQSN